MINKRHLAKQLSRKLDVTQAQALGIIEGVFESITECLIAKNEVSITGFGTWHLKARAAQTLKNPKTLKPMHLPQRLSLQFSPSQVLKTKLKDPS